jgi:hypothetical protein
VAAIEAACTLSSGVKTDVIEYLTHSPKKTLGYDGMSTLSKSLVSPPADTPVNEEEEKEKIPYQQIINFLRPKAVKVYFYYFHLVSSLAKKYNSCLTGGFNDF